MGAVLVLMLVAVAGAGSGPIARDLCRRVVGEWRTDGAALNSNSVKLRGQLRDNPSRLA